MRNQCAFRPAPSSRMESTTAVGAVGISRKSPFNKCLAVCANPEPYTQTRTQKNTAMNILATNSSSAAAAYAHVSCFPCPSLRATWMSDGEFAEAAWRMNHFAVSRGVLSSPIISHENCHM